MPACIHSFSNASSCLSVGIPEYIHSSSNAWSPSFEANELRDEKDSLRCSLLDSWDSLQELLVSENYKTTIKCIHTEDYMFLILYSKIQSEIEININTARH